MICPGCNALNEDDAERCTTCRRTIAGVPLGSILASRYEILERLGKGGMGIVYKARDRALNETVAVKVLRSDVAATPAMAQRFQREIRTARSISHRNVCRIHDYGEDGGIRFISMAFVDGVDLRNLLRHQGALPAREALDLGLQIADGLQAIHDEGVVHRDLKPGNLMRDKRGVVRVMDFGIAKPIGSGEGLTSTGLAIGTPEYMSPEQVRAEDVDHRTDIYALGVVLFEMFTGKVPFDGRSFAEIAAKHLSQAPPLENAALPPALVPVLRRALAKDPAERYGMVREMIDGLRRAQAATSPAVAPERTAVVQSAAVPALVPAHDPTPTPQAAPAPIVIEPLARPLEAPDTVRPVPPARPPIPQPPPPAPRTLPTVPLLSGRPQSPSQPSTGLGPPEADVRWFAGLYGAAPFAWRRRGRGPGGLAPPRRRRPQVLAVALLGAGLVTAATLVWLVPRRMTVKGVTPRVVLDRSRVPMGAPLEWSFVWETTPDYAGVGKGYRIAVHVFDDKGRPVFDDDLNHIGYQESTPSYWRPGGRYEYVVTTFVPVTRYNGPVEVRAGLVGSAVWLNHDGEDRGWELTTVARFTLLPQTENIFVIHKEGWEPVHDALRTKFSDEPARVSFKNPRADVIVYLDASIDGPKSPQGATLTLTVGGSRAQVGLPCCRVLTRVRFRQADVSRDDEWLDLTLSIVRPEGDWEFGLKVYHLWVGTGTELGPLSTERLIDARPHR